VVIDQTGMDKVILHTGRILGSKWLEHGGALSFIVFDKEVCLQIHAGFLKRLKK
jgi:hypothetical protein